MEGEDLMSMTPAERKAAAREAKRKRQEELAKNAEKFEYEEYNVQKKATTTQSHKEKQEQMRREKEEKEKEHRRQQQKGGPTKLSKPEPAKSAFIFFKEAHAKLSAEEVKTAWANLPEADKQTYKDKAQADKQREKEEKEKWAEAQALKEAQKNSKKGKERR